MVVKSVLEINFLKK